MSSFLVSLQIEKMKGLAFLGGMKLRSCIIALKRDNGTVIYYETKNYITVEKKTRTLVKPIL